MIIHYLLNFKEYTKCKSDQVSKADTLLDLLSHLSEKYGNKFRNAVFNKNSNDFGDDIVVLVNGRNVALTDGIQTRLAPDDTIALFPMIMGG